MPKLTNDDFARAYLQNHSDLSADLLLKSRSEDTLEVGLAKAVARECKKQMGRERSREAIGGVIEAIQATPVMPVLSEAESICGPIENSSNETIAVVISLKQFKNQIFDEFLMRAFDPAFPKDLSEPIELVKKAVSQFGSSPPDQDIEHFLRAYSPCFFEYCASKCAGSVASKNIEFPKKYSDGSKFFWERIVDALLITMNINGERPVTHGKLVGLVRKIVQGSKDGGPKNGGPAHNSIVSSEGHFARYPKFFDLTKS